MQNGCRRRACKINLNCCGNYCKRSFGKLPRESVGHSSGASKAGSPDTWSLRVSIGRYYKGSLRVNRAFISMGSNMGDRLNNLVEAAQAVHGHARIKIMSVSSIYETVPIGYTNQADFLNLVISVETELDAQQLLVACQGVESKLGRIRDVRWGPRTSDLDILLYNNDTIEAENLIVPHPRMHERAFVLIPLLEISSTIAHPATGMLFSEEEAVHDGGVKLWKKVDGVEEFLLLG